MIAQGLNRILMEDLYRSTVEVQTDEHHQNSPLKIIQNWYMQHPETVELTLE